MNNAFTDYLDQMQTRDAAPADVQKVAPDPAIGGEANDYLDSLRQRQDMEDGTLNAFARAHKANPDEWAKMLQKGEAAGLSREVMEQFPAEAERRARYDEAAKLSREAPKTAQWLARPDNAELAKDDTGPLADMERILAETVARVAAGGPIRKPYEFETQTKGALQSGMDRMGKGSAGLGAAGGEALSEYVTGPMARNRILPEDIGARIGAFYREQAKGWEAKAKQDRGDWSKLPWLGKAVLQGVESMPGSAGAAIVGVMTRNPGLSAMFMAAPVGGEGYVDAREKGKGVAQSITHGSSQAVIEYATEFIPAAKMLQDLGLQKTFLTTLRNNLAREIPGEQAATILQDLNDWATLNPDKPFADYIKARPGAAAETLVATIVATGGQIAVSRVADDTLRGNRGQADQAFMQSIGDAATASKLRERMPSKYRELVDEIAKGGPVENIRIPAETFATYFQTVGLDPVAVAQEVGARNFDAALAAHTDIIIPVGDYAAKIAATEHHAALMPDIRLRDGDLTAREYEAYKADRAEMDAQMATEAGQQAGGEKKDALSIIEAHFRDQLLALGRSPAVADAYATAQARPIMRLAEEAGVDPMAIIEKYGLTVTSPLPDVLTKKGTTEASIDALLERLRTGDIPQDEAIYGQRLTDFLRKSGGINDTQGELKGRDLDKNLKPGQSRLVRDDGLDFDAALTAARQAGYLPEAPADRPDETGINDLLDALLQDEQTGVFSSQSTNDELLQLRGMLESLGGYLDSLGIDLTQIADNAQVRELMKQAGEVVGEMADGYTLAQSMDGGKPSPERIAEAARQLAEVRAQYEGTDQWMKAPNGEPTKLNERQWLQVRADMFRDWFGDWENDPAGASKVVDANGEPMVVYHGSPDARFMNDDATFRNRWTGSTKGAHWFTPSRKTATTYADDRRAFDYQNADPDVIPAFINLRNPSIVEANGSLWRDAQRRGKTSDVIEEAQQSGNDGVIIRDVKDDYENGKRTIPTDTMVAFDSAQVKSAIGNAGTFSGDTGNVLFQRGYIESPRGKRDDYTIDLFGNETGIPAATRPDTAGVSGDVQPAAAISRDDAPGTYATRTEIVEENTRTLGIDIVASPADAAQAMAYLARGAVERFDALVTDKDGKPLAVVGAFKGALSQAAVYPSTVVSEAFRIPGAANIWFAHNHPGGIAELSDADRHINNQLTEAFRGSQIAPSGILAIGKGVGDGRSWVHTLNAGAMDTYGATSAPAQDATVPVVERVFTSEKKLGPPISGPVSARQAVESIAEKETGVILLDSQNTPVAFVPITPETTLQLRTDGRMDAMYRALSMANAAAAIIVNNGNMGRLQVANLAGLFNSIGARVIDVFETSHTPAKSLAEHGMEPKDTTFFQSADAKRGYITIGADRKLSIALLEKANLSTFLHETGHAYLEIMGDLAESAGASEQLKADWAKTLKFLKVATRAEIGVEQHEMWARANEAYLMEGNAPSAELRGVFQKFKSWLKLIYKQIDALNVKLTPEVRGVFDRLYASEAEIESAKKEAETRPLFLDAATAGMTEAEFALYTKAIADGTETAKENLETRLMREQMRETQKWWKDARDALKAEVTAEVEATPVYRAFAALSAGQMPDGTPMKLSRDDLVKRYGEAWLKKLPRGFGYLYAKDGGSDIQTAAELLGFSDADALVNALADMRPKKELIEAETDARMRDTYGDTLNDAEAMRQAAVSALHNDRQAEVLALELRALRKKRLDVAPFVRMERDAGKAALREEKAQSAEEAHAERTRQKAEKQAARAVVDAIPPLSAFRDAAAGMISQMQARDIRPGDYLRASQKANKDAFKAMARDDHQAAYEAKRRELLNHYLYREALAAREEMDKLLDYARSFEKSSKRQRIGKAGADYLEQIDGLLERWEFKRVSMRTMDRRTSLALWAEKMEAEGHAVNVDPELLDDAKIVNFREASMDTLRAVRDALVNIEHLAGLKNKLLKSKDQREFDAIADEISASIRNSAPARKILIEDEGKVSKIFNGFMAGNRKLSSLVRQMDGGDENGPFYTALVRGMNEQGAWEAVENAKATEALAAIYEPLLKSGGVTGDIRYIDGANISLSRGGRLAFGLNWGNSGNRQRLGSSDFGTGVLSPAQIDAVLSTLTREEWEFVENTWKFIDSYWTQIAEKQKRVTGIMPEKVEAEPFTRTLADGSTIKLSGGYYPIAYDSSKDDRASVHEAADIADRMMLGAFTAQTTKKGHTEARMSEVKRPLRLSLDVITEHVAQVTHDLAWHEWLIDATKLLRSGRISSAIREHYGNAVLKTMRDAMTGIAVGDLEGQTAIDKMLLYLRANVSRSTMGLSLTTAFLQPFGLFQSAVRIGPKYVLRGMAQWAGDAARFENTLATVREKSEFMRLRGTTFNRELNEIRGRTTGGQSRAKQIYDASLFMLMQKMQMVADVPTWLGAYEKALDNGSDEAGAVSIADRAVIESQGGGQTKDLSEFQRKHPMLTMFYSYFNVTYNLMAESTAATNFKSPLAVAGWISDMAMLTIIPALGPALILALLRGDDGDEEEWAKSLLKWQAAYLLGTVPMLREASGLVEGYDYAGPPAGRLVGDTLKLAVQIGQGEMDEGAVLSAIRFIGGAFGIPTTQLIRTYRGWQSWSDGEAPASSVLAGPPRQ